MSLSLAAGASAATAVPSADTPSGDTAPPQITLSEEEIADVSLGTFYVFDKENAGTRVGERFANGAEAAEAAAEARVAPALKAMTITMSLVLTESSSGALKAATSPVGTPWMWTLAYGHHEDRTPTHGYEATRQAATHSFARSWHRET
jgi:hypothetical protein